MIRSMADMLLEKETIGIADIQSIFGPRPFETSEEFKKYLEEKTLTPADIELKA
jgi:hypothetical protein